MSEQPEGTQLVTQLGDAVGGPETPGPDPETETVDLRRKLWNVQRLGESMAEDRDETVRRCGEQVLAVLGDAARPVAAALTLPADEFAALRSVAVATGLLPAEAAVAPSPGSGTDDTGRAPLASPEQSRERSDGSDEERAEPHMNLLDTAWGVIANAGWDDCAKTPGWQEAAERWRDDYHRWLDLHLRPGGYHTWEQLADSLVRERDALFSEVAGLRLERARAGSAALIAADLDLETPAASWRELEEAVRERNTAEAKLAGITTRCQRRLDMAIVQSPVSDLCRDILAIIGTEGDGPFTPDIGHPSAADRAMVARATGGGIRSREVQPEFGTEGDEGRG